MKKILLLVYSLVAFITLEASDIPAVHQAFIQVVRDLTPSIIVKTQPPEPLEEKPPKQHHSGSVWIPGYWMWNMQAGEYEWVCGIWRLPPPDHSWLSGYWIEVEEGWVWVRGAWIESKNQTITTLVYAQEPPPATLNENTDSAPDNSYFWAMGYWSLNSKTTKFEWLSGSWQKFNPNWIFVAAQWIWRPEGYLFVPAYWDWKLESRGFLFDCTNQVPIATPTILVRLSLNYPDYTAECCHYFHYKPSIWKGCDCLPPWWSWNQWWSIPWNQSWWLLWWYTHPEYPYPPFATSVIEKIPPAKPSVASHFELLDAPFYITPYGVPTLEQWKQASNRNLIPFENVPKVIQKLDLPKTGSERPAGKSRQTVLEKPFETETASAGKGIVPPIPKVTPAYLFAPMSKASTQIYNIPPVQFLPEPSYNPTLRVYPAPVYVPQQYPRYYGGWQTWDSEGRRRGAHHRKVHDGGGHKGGGGKGGGKSKG
jgi:hypothetical protein